MDIILKINRTPCKLSICINIRWIIHRSPDRKGISNSLRKSEKKVDPGKGSRQRKYEASSWKRMKRWRIHVADRSKRFQGNTSGGSEVTVMPLFFCSGWGKLIADAQRETVSAWILLPYLRSPTSGKPREPNWTRIWCVRPVWRMTRIKEMRWSF